MKTYHRIICLLLLIFGTHLLVSWVQANHKKGEISSPTLDVQNLPYAFAGWEGSNVELDERVFANLGADSAINRLYKGPNGEQVAVHIALWNENDNWLPHPPDMCYTKAGWKIGEQSKVTLNSVEPIKVQSCKFDREGSAVVTLFWYQLGDQIYFDKDGARAAQQKLWGNPKWPPLVKVLTQTSGYQDARSEEHLVDIASHIRNWTATLKPEASK